MLRTSGAAWLEGGEAGGLDSSKFDGGASVKTWGQHGGLETEFLKTR